MSNEEKFQQISADFAAGRTGSITIQVMDIVNSTDDPFEILKGMSLLKLVPDDGTESKVANILVDKTNPSQALEVASALRNLDCPTFAIEILKKAPLDDRAVRLKCHCLFDMEEYESAYDLYNSIKNPVINDRILLCDILSAIGEHTTSMATSTQLLKEFPDDYDVRIAYVKSLIMGGHEKDAAKYARAAVKDKTADSNAVAAYVLRISGNTKAAAGFATRAIQLDNGHIGAMETLGICLALKGEYDKAKITAGAINEISPGDKAAINILSYCEGN